MNKVFVPLFFVLINVNIFSENIIGEWYRNSLYRTAELTINQDLTFFIEATNTAYSGRLEGKLEKIRDGYYFSYINDEFDTGQSCIIIFIEHLETMELVVYGDQVGAGHSVYYDGIYEKNRMTNSEYIEKALVYIIGNYYDKNIVKNLLGNDLEYFTGCFGVAFVKNIGNSIIIEGWMPGVAPSQNGIIKIENNKIHILITDCEYNILRYYTNNSTQQNIPDEFKNWSYFNSKMDIINIIREIE